MTTSQTPHPGLRERKKQATREQIAEVARRLFTERGFDAVPVAEVAREADVSEKTVFNYFAVKEDLVYWRLESFENELLGAIREREPGESIFAAFSRFVLAQRGLLAADEPEAAERLAGITRMICESPALLERERQIFDRYTTSLADLIAAETGRDEVEARVIANALMGVHRALIDYTRARILAGARGPALARAVRARGKRGLATLERGLDM
ncbi:MAG TPA: TetR/AcrR family transcriptional regulator [Thermoleophilaceae bacterium]|jgi:AcrR family transcriptional regulator